MSSTAVLCQRGSFWMLQAWGNFYKACVEKLSSVTKVTENAQVTGHIILKIFQTMVNDLYDAP